MPSIVVEAIEEDRKSEISEEKSGIGELTVATKVGEVEPKEKAGKIEVCLVEKGKNGEGAEHELTVWEEGINEEGVRWFSSVVADYERKSTEAGRREIENIRTQGLLRDFPNLKVGGLLPQPKSGETKPTQFMTKEWTVIVACLLYTSPSPRD